MLGVEEARQKILDAVGTTSTETVFLGDAHDRVLAETLQSRRSVPGFDNSAMDGYGVRAADVEAASKQTPVSLTVVGAVQAGSRSTTTVAAGQAIRIMTGAPIPQGADAVVMRESTDEKAVGDDGTGTVVVHEAVAQGQHVRARGEDVKDGAVVGQPGDRLSPARINLLAQCGHVAVTVRRRPVVAILASGDELKELGAPFSDDDVINSNAHAIAAAVRATGGVAHLVGIAKDTLEDHVRRIQQAAHADVLITIGGVSVGTHDFVKPALLQCGVKLELWKVAMRPGKPLAFGVRDAQIVFGLPGNPVSSLVGFELFVRPALWKLMGLKHVVKRPVRARLVDEEIKKKAGLQFYLRATVMLGADGFEARVLDKQGSGQISGLAAANALVVLGEDVERAKRGDLVDAILLDESTFAA